MDANQSSDADATEASPGQAQVAGPDSEEDDDDDSEMEMDGGGEDAIAAGLVLKKSLAHLPVYPSLAQLFGHVAAFRAVSISACVPG
jgi:hypothetical protein